MSNSVSVERDVGDLDEQIELIERLFVLADEDQDPRELVLEVRPLIRIPGHGKKLHGAAPLSDGFVLLPR